MYAYRGLLERHRCPFVVAHVRVCQVNDTCEIISGQFHVTIVIDSTYHGDDGPSTSYDRQ
jgi:hypothetical protein